MEYKGCIVTQSNYNNHITVSKDGNVIAHFNCTEKKTDEELREMVDFALAVRDLPKTRKNLKGD